MLLGFNSLHPADTFVLIGYFVLMLGIGAYFYRHMHGMKDYFSGGNRIPWWLSGVSFYMSCFSVFGFVVYSALAFQYGWVPVTAFWAYIPATLLGALVFAPRWRRARIDSPVEYLESRYNPAMRQICAWQGIPVNIIDDALKLVAIGIFVSTSLGLGLKESMIGCGLIMLAYTFMGGLWAVTVTDFVQFIVMAAAVLALFPLAMAKAGGIGSFVANSPEGFFKPVGGEYGWIYIASLVFMFALSMSSSDYNVCAGVVTNDIYRRLIRPKASQRELVLIGRLTTLLIGLIALGTAFLVVNLDGEGLFRSMVQLFSVATAPVAIPMLLGLLSRRMTTAGAIAGFITGLAAGLLLFFVLPDTVSIGEMVFKKENILLASTAAATAVVMTAVSYLVPRSDREAQRVDRFLHRLSIPIGEMEEDNLTALTDFRGKGASPSRVVGVFVVLTGVMMLVVLPFVEGRLAFGTDLGIGIALILLGIGLVGFTRRARQAVGDSTTAPSRDKETRT